MDRKAYPTDLTDEQWLLLEPLLPAATPGGRSGSVDLREIVNSLLDLLRTGCPWRSLPHDLPPWSTVWTYFRRWRDDGTLTVSTPNSANKSAWRPAAIPSPALAVWTASRSRPQKKGGAWLRC